MMVYLGARDRNQTVFERLTQHFEGMLVELGQLVGEEHAVVGQRDLAGHGIHTASDQCHLGDGVVRTAKRTLRDQSLAGRQLARNGVDLRRLQALRERQRGSIDGKRLAIILLPDPGGPIITRL